MTVGHTMFTKRDAIAEWNKAYGPAAGNPTE